MTEKQVQINTALTPEGKVEEMSSKKSPEVSGFDHGELPEGGDENSSSESPSALKGEPWPP